MSQQKKDTYTNNGNDSGSSQHTRLSNELLPENLKIDERTLPDLIEFARRYAKHVNFVSASNLDSEDFDFDSWEPFFNKDNLIILIACSKYNVVTVEQRAHAKIDKAIQATDVTLRKNLISDVINDTLVLGNRLDYLHKNIQKNILTSDFLFDIKNAIHNDLNTHLQVMYQYKHVLQWDSRIEERFDDLFQSWSVSNNVAFVAGDEIMLQDIFKFKNILNSFFYTAQFVMVKSKKLVESMMIEMEDNKPHIALFVTFLELFKHAQELQNEIPKKHLNHYYKEELMFKTKNAKMDKSMVSFVLAPNKSEFFIAPDTKLKAGEDEHGNKIRFKTDNGLWVNNTTIKKVCGLYKSIDSRNQISIADNFVTAIFQKEATRDDKKQGFVFDNWPIVGEDQFDKIEGQKSMQEGRFGFIISSPVLKISSGKRIVKCVIVFEEDGFLNQLEELKKISRSCDEQFDETVYKIFQTGLECFVSKEQDQLEPKNYTFYLNETKNAWELEIEIGALDTPLTQFESNTKLFPTTKHPFVYVKLKQSCKHFMHSIMSQLCIKEMVVNTQVSGVKNVQLYNVYGQVDIQKPFELFGTIPVKGDYFVLGHSEVFSKRLDQVSVSLDWHQLPIKDGGVEKYFETYINRDLQSFVKENVATEKYTLSISALNNGLWDRTNTGEFRLFKNKISAENRLDNTYSDQFTCAIDGKEIPPMSEKKADAYMYNQESAYGWLKCQLNCPSFAFGHKDYGPMLSDVVLKNAKPKRKKNTIPLPNNPFSLAASNISLAYEASVSSLNNLVTEEVSFYHVTPFGYKQVPLKKDNPVALIHNVSAFGNLMLGLDSYPYGGELNILLVIDEAEKKANTQLPDVNQVTWKYLANDEWYTISKTKILSDTTNGFMNTGIVQMTIPEQIKKDNSIMDSSLLWIKAEINDHAGKLGQLKVIMENAVSVTRVQEAEVSDVTKIREGSITSFEEKVPEISEVFHVLKSFEGCSNESEHQFYQRVSERLRHKGRAILAQDYEDLILENFPTIFKVTCFSASHVLQQNNDNQKHAIKPGKVKLVLQPNLTEASDWYAPKASASEMIKIKKYLDEISNPFVENKVINPFYEQVKIFCKVGFRGNESDSYNEKKLQNELVSFINPWFNTGFMNLELGNSIYLPEVLGFIQNRPYVGFVTGFSMIKIVEEDDCYNIYDSVNKGEDEKEIMPVYPWSILTSVSKHGIQVLDEPVFEDAERRTVSNMVVGEDFIITD